MKKLFIYMQVVVFVSLLAACGGQRENERDVTDTVDDMMPYDDPVPPIDTLRRDSVDTLGQPLPTPEETM